MTKVEFIAALKDASPELFPTKTAAKKAYMIFCALLAEAAVTEKGVRLLGVGSFAITHRAARTGRNPRTGTSIRIPPRRVVKFTPARGLAEKVK